MPKSTLTRRALVASTAAVPAAAALGLPAVAQAVVEPDRIFAAIEQFKSGVAALVSGYDGPRHDAVEEAFMEWRAPPQRRGHNVFRQPIRGIGNGNRGSRD
jgi:hypothetical protein